MPTPQLPTRYQPIECLGSGGGGEVWAVRDRPSGRRFALKILAEGATAGEMDALVREAGALSGLEGLGFPRVVQFGRLPEGRPYMVRELVAGRSLQDVITEGKDLPASLQAVLAAARQITRVHRAGFFHGDIKPANIIVQASGSATLVDLGLVAPWQDGHSHARGLTPHYAAPELLQGRPLTPRSEVYAFGATLNDILQGFQLDASLRARLASVAARATQVDPGQRYPSADEFASDLQRAAQIAEPDAASSETDGAPLVWPIVGIDSTSQRLLEGVQAMPAGGALLLAGERGCGRSALLRRLSWALGVGGIRLSWVDGRVPVAPGELDSVHQSVQQFVEQELSEHRDLSAVRILVDHADELDEASVKSLLAARQAGACLIVSGGGELAREASVFDVPPLAEFAAFELVRRAVPSLSESISRRLIARAGGRPGELRRLLGLLAMRPVVREQDIDELVAGVDELLQAAPSDPIDRTNYFLEHGRYGAAREAVAGAGSSLVATIARARVDVGLGEAASAVRAFESVAEQVDVEGHPLRDAWLLWYGRALIGVGSYSRAADVLGQVAGDADVTALEGLAYEGFALSHLGEPEKAITRLERAVRVAEDRGLARVAGVALACLGLVRQRREELAAAQSIYQRAIEAATRANDASTLGTAQLNLATLLRVKGDLAGAIEHYDAAADMGRRSGRVSTVQNALLNVANTDLYLGRIARARYAIETLENQREQLSAVQRAQLLGLQAAALTQEGEFAHAAKQYERSAAAYEELGRTIDAAEALLEGALVTSRQESADVAELRETAARARTLLGESGLWQHLLMIVKARIARLAGDEVAAREALDAALAAARSAGERDWIWLALASRAELEASNEQPMKARRDREDALAVLEDIAARLPRDLREVFWNDRQRSELRDLVESNLGHASTHLFQPHSPLRSERSAHGSAISSLTSTPLEQRLARILEINRELLLEFDVTRLTEQVTRYAVELLEAERGSVILRETDGSLEVHTTAARPGDEMRSDFSRSIAQQVMATRAPVVSLNARQDVRMKAFESVHELMLEAVACVPITGRSGAALGALYLEAKQRPGRMFEREVPMLQAFADQVGLALETARLVSENRSRADELSHTNEQLRAAEQRLRELLGERTEKLKLVRRRLRDARDTLNARFGYHGMVGTSEAMRRVYALIDRVKDTDVPLLITGESGTGKEVAARAIHRASPRHKSPLLAINCGAIPEHLLESELFGHVRGAFTGADRERKGLIREAQGGAVLLDEIGEMPHKMQAGLLRVLQEHKVRPVGGTTEEPVDVRFIFATHRDLEQLVREGKFREDLYYRIHVVELHMPSLSQRRDDIPALVDHFLGIFAARYRRERKALTRDSLRLLMDYDWPGNVRQLEHVLLNAWILSDQEEIEPEDIELPVRALSSVPGAAAPSQSPPELRSQVAGLSRHRNEERERILEALRASSWNRVKAAELIGIPRRTFYRRLREYKIQ